MDAIDTALVDFRDQDLTVIKYYQFPIPNDVQTTVRNVTGETTLTEITELDNVLGGLFADAVNNILKTAGLKAGDITAVGSHGQTVLHLPVSTYPRTLQIGNPAMIAVRSGITTVADFRRGDIAAGGQGAPLTCAFHAWRFRSSKVNRSVLNLGGMANITVLPADPVKEITGFDTGPGNSLMDGWVQRHLHKDYDRDGLWAASGTCNDELLKVMLEEPYFKTRPPKSTGKDDFNLAWLESKLAVLNKDLDPADVQATLLELTARTISVAISGHAPASQEILLCGGGTHNPVLVQRLKQLLTKQAIVTTGAYGIHPDAVEAITFAWLAKCRLENVPANIPAVTGATKKVVLGAIYHP